MLIRTSDEYANRSLGLFMMFEMTVIEHVRLILYKYTCKLSIYVGYKNKRKGSEDLIRPLISISGNNKGFQNPEAEGEAI